VIRALLVAVAVALAVPATVGAATIREDLEAAHVYWQTGVAVPEPVDVAGNVCRSSWVVVPDATVTARNAWGEATGVQFTHNPAGGVYEAAGTRWDWHIARCEFSLHPGLSAPQRRCVVRHEVGHFIHGPWHHGAMSADAAHACLTAASAAVPAVTVRAPRIARQVRLEARALIVEMLPAPRAAWRVTCGPTRASMRCRAQRGRSARRFVVRHARDELTVEAVSRDHHSRPSRDRRAG
jgi:hypothetical protein